MIKRLKATLLKIYNSLFYLFAAIGCFGASTYLASFINNKTIKNDILFIMLFVLLNISLSCGLYYIIEEALKKMKTTHLRILAVVFRAIFWVSIFFMIYLGQSSGYFQS